MVEKNRRVEMFCDTWKLYQIHISMFIKQFYWNRAMVTHLHFVKAYVLSCYHGRVDYLWQRLYGLQALLTTGLSQKMFANFCDK